MAAPGKFLYFGFGSNLLRERIHIQNPTAVFKTTAQLKDYKLEFDYGSARWHGAAATVTQSPGDEVWGVVWEIDEDQRHHLDNQEGVHDGVYEPINIEVVTSKGEILKCLSYSLLMRDADDKRPSPQYLDVILRGARQNNLPEHYLDFLRGIEHNGYSGHVDVHAGLGIKM